MKNIILSAFFTVTSVVSTQALANEITLAGKNAENLAAALVQAGVPTKDGTVSASKLSCELHRDLSFGFAFHGSCSLIDKNGNLMTVDSAAAVAIVGALPDGFADGILSGETGAAQSVSCSAVVESGGAFESTTCQLN